MTDLEKYREKARTCH